MFKGNNGYIRFCLKLEMQELIIVTGRRDGNLGKFINHKNYAKFNN